MSKSLCRVFLSLLLACLGLVSAVLPADAAPVAVKTSVISHLSTRDVQRWKGRRGWQTRFWRGRRSHGGPGIPEINQYFHGNTDYNHFYYIVGVNRQANSGNVGVNRGHNQDNSVNGGNQMLLSGRLRYRRVNQYYYGNSHFNRRSIRIGGYDQVNSGNDGWNRGVNQDNSSNGGNQIVG